MVRLNPIVRVLVGVVERARHELIDDGEERPGPVGHDLGRLAIVAERAEAKNRGYREMLVARVRVRRGLGLA
jgi:hypothetical protein